MKKIINTMKKEIRDGLVAYMAKKDPGKSISTYKTYASDSNYLLNNDYIDEFIRFVRSTDDDISVKQLIYQILRDHRGEVKAQAAVDYYYEKLCWQREYIRSIGGIDDFLRR